MYSTRDFRPRVSTRPARDEGPGSPHIPPRRTARAATFCGCAGLGRWGSSDCGSQSSARASPSPAPGTLSQPLQRALLARKGAWLQSSPSGRCPGPGLGARAPRGGRARRPRSQRGRSARRVTAAVPTSRRRRGRSGAAALTWGTSAAAFAGSAWWGARAPRTARSPRTAPCSASCLAPRAHPPARLRGQAPQASAPTRPLRFARGEGDAHARLRLCLRRGAPGSASVPRAGGGSAAARPHQAERGCSRPARRPPAPRQRGREGPGGARGCRAKSGKAPRAPE